MCARYLGFVLLIWFAGVTHAQNENVCRAPVLNGGYYVPEKETYLNKAELTYACDSGLKPVVEGWWARSRCEDGNWVHKPQCIDQNACLPPTISHGKYDKAEDGWYKERYSILVQCDDGYERKGNSRPRCRSGTWSPLPVCERRRDSCSEPPKISHAVIIHQYKEVFSAGSEVQYECEEGYTREGNNIIICERGQWTAGPTCNKSSADQGHSASDTDVQPEGGDRRESGAGSGKQPEGAFCVMNAARYAHYGLAAAEPENMWEGQDKYFSCIARDKYIRVRCTNRRLDFTRCCDGNEFQSFPDCYRFGESY
ncbi:complement factor H-related protein 2 [Maylandia zebra]|uniref:Coagulation factor XIII B chain n=1 Tax=Maylandia zebra TaxID=106582 RepID=A0A3P9BJQ7_9CICH|nr:coagulation factor XIII B chain [Maylandia zebra]